MVSGRFFPRIYWGMKSIGPGRYKEIPAITSSKLWGLSSFIKLFIPALSSWNTPSEWPEPKDPKTFLSSKSMLSIAISFPVSFLISFTAFWITVSVRSPRKSIFKSPSSSSVVMVNWVVMEPSWARDKGTYSSTSFWLITTPAACIEVCRGSPSRRFAISMR